MYVACPACKSVYAIQPAHLRAGGGELHCGSCGARFNATAAVFDDAQQALDYAVQQQGVAREIDALVGRALEQVPDQDAGDRFATAGAADAPHVASEPLGAQQDAGVDRLDGYYASDQPSTQAEPAVADAAAIAFDLDSFYAPDDEPVASELPGIDPGAMADHLHGFHAFEAPFEDPLPAVTGRADGPLPVPDTGPGPEPDIYSIQLDRDCYAQPPAVEFGAREMPADAPWTAQPVPYLLDEPDIDERGISWGAIAASMLLIVLLGVQFAWQQRYRLAETGGLRPVMETFCAVLHCDLPLRREPLLVDMIEREVRDHPVVRGALLINAAFINRASFRQTYPVFQISFSDVSGTLVAIRRFAPEEYLPDQRRAAQGMKAGEQAYVTLEVIDPGTQAVSFQFEFF